MASPSYALRQLQCLRVYDDTVVNTVPWVTTIAATTIDRDFPNILIFGNNVCLRRTSLEATLDSNALYLMIGAPVPHLQSV
jgi:presenilin-like A22 family membrane protease